MAKQKRAAVKQAAIEESLTRAFEVTLGGLYRTYFVARAEAGDPPDQAALEQAGERFKRALKHAKASLDETLALVDEV